MFKRLIAFQTIKYKANAYDVDIMKILSPIYRFYEKRLWKQIKDGPKPHHIGVILDGNRRYARKKGLEGKEGHL
ncbi:MAG: hypothetical protein ACTSQB_04320, partial [Candidatus Heimdallarchaeota archaeon]